ncbi:MAG: pentapeptide repeat-containing protein, partial [Lachnospiraceae bacterium]|nr:pentapeptide repeat-containing protein [Lachnospiraceae bacterium]
MNNEEIIEELNKLGYNRKNKDYYIENGTICGQNYIDKTLNHSILSKCKIENVIFDNASLTGSIFRTCKFSNCSIIQTDFEFCCFNDCYLKSKSKITASFNNTNFINTEFEDLD